MALAAARFPPQLLLLTLGLKKWHLHTTEWNACHTAASPGSDTQGAYEDAHFPALRCVSASGRGGGIRSQQKRDTTWSMTGQPIDARCCRAICEPLAKRLWRFELCQVAARWWCSPTFHFRTLECHGSQHWPPMSSVWGSFFTQSWPETGHILTALPTGNLRNLSLRMSTMCKPCLSNEFFPAYPT